MNILFTFKRETVFSVTNFGSVTGHSDRRQDEKRRSFSVKGYLERNHDLQVK